MAGAAVAGRGRSRWLRRPRTIRARLTLLYSGLFLVSGFLVLAIANVGARTSDVAAVSFRPDPSGVQLPMPPPDVDRLAISSIIALVVMLLVSIGVGWVVAGRTLRPLRTITTTAQEISASNLHERLNLRGPDDEITELGATLDDLLGRLEASFDSQRHFVANASHELRTPLTAERALLQVALADPDASVVTLRSACEEVLAIGAQQERLIAALLTLASGERGIDEREPFDLAVVAADVVAQRRGAAEAGGVTVDAHFGRAPTVGDPDLVERLVANLVDNAVRHNRSDGTVGGARVEVWTGVVEGRSVIRVGNTGPAVPVDEVARLFEPFQRLTTERTSTAADAGHGLGLAIVKAIADAHGALMVARPRLSGGLDVEIAFGDPPRRKSADPSVP